MKNIIFTVCALLFLLGGIYLFDIIESKIPDANWLIVGAKILIALVALILYAIILKFFANIFNITWNYPIL